MSLLQRRLTTAHLAELIDTAAQAAVITPEQRDALSARFRAIPTLEQRRLDAWTVERAGRASCGFAWSPATARRILGNNALRRCRDPRELLSAVRDEVADQLLRAVRGHARSGSLAHWLAGVSHPVLGLITSEAYEWAMQALECAEELDQPWRVASSDAYYDVARARTTLRGRRDLIVDAPEGRVVLRIRNGLPGKSAGPGLRCDLTAETLAHPEGLAPRRFLGLWPEAGLILGVDGDVENLRLGARDLLRSAVVRRRQSLKAVV